MPILCDFIDDMYTNIIIHDNIQRDLNDYTCNVFSCVLSNIKNKILMGHNNKIENLIIGGQDFSKYANDFYDLAKILNIDMDYNDIKHFITIFLDVICILNSDKILN